MPPNPQRAPARGGRPGPADPKQRRQAPPQGDAGRKTPRFGDFPAGGPGFFAPGFDLRRFLEGAVRPKGGNSDTLTERLDRAGQRSPGAAPRRNAVADPRACGAEANGNGFEIRERG